MKIERKNTLLAIGLGLACALLYVGQILVVRAAVFGQHPMAQPVAVTGHGGMTLAAVLALPMAVLTPGFAPSAAWHVVFVVLGCAQALALYGFFRVTGDGLSRGAVVAVALIAAAMGVCAVVDPAMTAFDVYAYVGYGKLGLAHAYAPPAGALAGSFAAVSAIWGDPLTPSVYGPLWVMLESAAVAGAHTLAGAVYASRLVGAVSLAIVFISLAVAGVPRRTVSLCALNPALWDLYVANAHNDIIAIAALIAAFAASRRIPLLSVVLIACAGLVKLPFTLLGVAALSGITSLPRRVLFLIAAVVLVLAGSWIGGGSAYLHDLTGRAVQVAGGATSPLRSASVLALRIGLGGAAVVALGVLLVRRRAFALAPWSMAGLGFIIPYAWYLGWGLPYALTARGIADRYLIALPLVAVLLCDAFTRTGVREVTVVVLAAVSIYGLLRLRAVADEPVSLRPMIVR